MEPRPNSLWHSLFHATKGNLPLFPHDISFKYLKTTVISLFSSFLTLHFSLLEIAIHWSNSLVDSMDVGMLLANKTILSLSNPCPPKKTVFEELHYFMATFWQRVPSLKVVEIYLGWTEHLKLKFRWKHSVVVRGWVESLDWGVYWQRGESQLLHLLIVVWLLGPTSSSECFPCNIGVKVSWNLACKDWAQCVDKCA